MIFTLLYCNALTHPIIGKVLLAEGDVDLEATYTYDLNLKEMNKAIVGFKTGLCEHLESLSIYVAKRLNDSERLLYQCELEKQITLDR